MCTAQTCSFGMFTWSVLIEKCSESLGLHDEIPDTTLLSPWIDPDARSGTFCTKPLGVPTSIQLGVGNVSVART